MNRKFLLFSLLVASCFTMQASDQPNSFSLSRLFALARSYVWQPAQPAAVAEAHPVPAEQAPAQPAAAAARAGEHEAFGSQSFDFNPETVRLRPFNIEEILSELTNVRTLQKGRILERQFNLGKGILFLKYRSDDKERIRAWNVQEDNKGIVSSLQDYFNTGDEKIRRYLQRVAMRELATSHPGNDLSHAPTDAVMRSLPLPKDMPKVRSPKFSLVLATAGVGLDHGIGDSDSDDDF